MAAFSKTVKTCAVCGRTSEQYITLADSDSNTTRDMDGRRTLICVPATGDSLYVIFDDGRRDHEKLINVCPHCGYAAYDLDEDSGDELSADDLKLIDSEEYRTCDGHCFESEYAAAYYRLYMMMFKRGHHEEAFHAVRRAAWSCDDAGDDENAVLCRKLAVAEKDSFTCEDAVTEETARTVQMDLMRRAGMFYEVVEKFGGTPFKDSVLEARRLFQLALAKKHDGREYIYDDCNHFNAILEKTGSEDECIEDVMRIAGCRRSRVAYYAEKEKRDEEQWREENREELEGQSEMGVHLMRDIAILKKIAVFADLFDDDEK